MQTWNDEDWLAYEVRPRYLAGSSSIGDPGFAAVPESWPLFGPEPDSGHHVVTSPDRRIHIGWDGDGLDELWRIAAYPGTVGLAWEVTANYNTAPEFIGALTEALVADYEAGDDAFLRPPVEGSLTGLGLRRGPVAAPLIDAGWRPDPTRGLTRNLISPDGLAGLRCHLQRSEPYGDRYVLWSGPDRWNRSRITFSEAVPDHLVAAVTTAFVSPEPLIRERHMIRAVEKHVTLTPVHVPEPSPPAPSPSATQGRPTPLDARRASVTAAVQRAHSSGQFAHFALRRSTAPAGPARPPLAEPVVPVPPGTHGRHR